MIAESDTISGWEYGPSQDIPVSRSIRFNVPVLYL